MLKPTLRSSGSTEHERYLSKLTDVSFFGLWSYSNVYTDEGIQGRKTGNELCDLLVVFDKNIIIFSDKSISFNSRADVEISWKRWFKRSVAKSARQLYGAEAWIRKYPDRVYLNSRCTEEFPVKIDLSDIKIHLAATTENTRGPAEKYWGNGSSGTLLQTYHLTEEDCLHKPFQVGDLHPEKNYVHIFDELALDVVMQELDTANDFCTYLEEKVKFIRSGDIFSAAGEEDLLALFCTNRGKKYPKGALIHPTGNIRKKFPIVACEGLYNTYARSENKKLYNLMRSESRLLDSIINDFSKGIVSANVALGKDLSFEVHERAVRCLASESRLSRFLLSRAISEKYSHLSGAERTSRLMFSPEFEGMLYVFVFFWPPEKYEDLEEYRERRLRYLDAYALVAAYKNHEAKIVVVLATESGFTDIGRSHDIVASEFLRPMSEESIEYARKLSAEHDILNESIVYEESTVSSPVEMRRTRAGRNSPCPCGSGVKYKKCCLLIDDYRASCV